MFYKRTEKRIVNSSYLYLFKQHISLTHLENCHILFFGDLIFSLFPLFTTEYSPLSKFKADNSGSDEEVILNDVSNLCNVRVIARQDSCPSPGSSELHFKAGELYPVVG